MFLPKGRPAQMIFINTSKIVIQVVKSNVGFLAGCYPGLALATAVPWGKCIGWTVKNAYLDPLH